MPVAPIPTTRRERHLFYRRRWIRKMRRRRTRGWAYDLNDEDNWVRVGRRWLIPLGPPQPPSDLIRPFVGHGDVSNNYTPPVPFTVTEATKDSPPHVTVGFSDWTVARALGSHPDAAIVGYHRRRVHTTGRKEGRMDGWARMNWGAFWFCLNEGFWPQWDPQQRHPNEADYEAGHPAFDPRPWQTIPPKPDGWTCQVALSQ